MNAVRRLVIALCIVVFATSCEDDSLTPNPTLIIQIDGVDLHYITLFNLKNNLQTEEISIFDPVHGKQKRYRAFLLKDILEYSYGNALTANIDNSTLTFNALDGFSATASGNRAVEDGGYLAFEDLDVAGEANWEKVASENNNDPAPFYIVWSGSDQNPTTNGYPWPYQLSQINLED
jgi:hypothetical protein